MTTATEWPGFAVRDPNYKDVVHWVPFTYRDRGLAEQIIASYLAQHDKVVFACAWPDRYASESAVHADAISRSTSDVTCIHCLGAGVGNESP